MRFWGFKYMNVRILSSVLLLEITFGTTISGQTSNQISAPDLGDKIEQFQAWMETNSGEDIITALQKFDLNDISRWLELQSEAKDQIERLEVQIKADELVVKEKRMLLADIQNKIDLLKLNTSQIAAIERYNHSLKQDPYFTEWITERTTWFEIGKDTTLSAAFFVLGIWIESARHKRKYRHDR
jgi:hypothetical protein